MCRSWKLKLLSFAQSKLKCNRPLIMHRRSRTRWMMEYDAAASPTFISPSYWLHRRLRPSIVSTPLPTSVTFPPDIHWANNTWLLIAIYLHTSNLYNQVEFFNRRGILSQSWRTLRFESAAFQLFTLPTAFLFYLLLFIFIWMKYFVWWFIVLSSRSRFAVVIRIVLLISSNSQRCLPFIFMFIMFLWHSDY